MNESIFGPIFDPDGFREVVYGRAWLQAMLNVGASLFTASNWTVAVMLDAGIILASFVVLLFVREPREEVEPSAPAGTSPEPG